MCQRICLEHNGIACVICGATLCLDATRYSNGITEQPKRLNSAFEDYLIWICRNCYLGRDTPKIAPILDGLYDNPPLYPPRIRFKKGKLRDRDEIRIAVQRIKNQ